MAELLFESHQVPALYISPPAILSLYASGRTTGIVLDVGHGTTHVIPVYEGYALKHSIGRSNVGGKDVDAVLQECLRKQVGVRFTTSAEGDLVKKMKEEICYVRTPDLNTGGGGGNKDKNNNNNDSSSASSASEQMTYQLPDGQTISLSSERHLPTEVLFNPSLIGSEEPNVAETLVSSISKSDLDLRSTLYTQIVLAGGTTLTPGFGNRLLHEVRKRVPVHTKIRISAPPERMYSAWAGGSILASLATFKNMWVTKVDYEEYGDSLIHRVAL
jgi:centractin